MGSRASAEVFYGIAFYKDRDVDFPWDDAGSLEEYILELRDKNNISYEDLMGNILLGHHGNMEYDSQEYIRIKGSFNSVGCGGIADLDVEIKPEWNIELNQFFERIGISNFLKEKDLKPCWQLVCYVG